MARRQNVNAQARHKKSTKSAAAKKAVKPAAKPKTPAKKLVKKPTPAKKPVTKKIAAKAAPKKATAKKVTPKKVVAKKPVPKKPIAKKPVAKKVPAKKVVAKKAPAKKVVAKKAPAKKVPAPKAKAPAKKVEAPKKSAATKAVAKPVVPAPVVHVTPIIPGYTPVVHKKNSRAAKMAALVPPPPTQVLASTAAKNSFMPISNQAATTIIPVIPKKDAKLANNWKTKQADQLTDAEVIAMPDSEYMNDVQMAFFRIKLVHLKDEVLTNASETTEHLREDTVVVPDPADRATIEEEHALELRTRDRERKLLKKIEQSIHRIDGGDYGYCDETGEPIGVARLLARPTATLSLEAQERRELKQKMFGD
jgi:DnaK suppressor protein